MPAIKKILGREIIDSRGNPTVEADVIFSDGSQGRAAVPSGASTGTHEATELRDGGTRYGGKGVRNAVTSINIEIASALARKTVDQGELDAKLIALDGTLNKSRLGANAILAVSLAFARAQAESMNIPLWKYFSKIAKLGEAPLLPVPMMNLLNGGKHAEGSADFQEYMALPVGRASFSEALRAGTEVFHALKKILSKRDLPTTVGDEGGFAPPIASNEEPFALLIEAIQAAGYKPGKDIVLGMDSASSELYKEGSYVLPRDKKTLTRAEMISLYEGWATTYPLASIEDPLFEDDYEGTALLTKALKKKTQIVGDDLFCTNPKRLADGIKQKAGSAILIKLNQIGSVSETIEAVRMAKKAGMGVVISHRSGETEDAVIAHLAVGLSAGQIKTGAPSRGERTAKYNELLRIEEELGKNAVYAGPRALKK
jgi:enolase